MVSLADMRRDARAAFDAAVAAVQPQRLVPPLVRLSGEDVLIDGEPLPRSAGRRVVMAIGKAAPGLAAAWLEAAPDWASDLFVLAPHDVPVPEEVGNAATVLFGAHPSPDSDGEQSTRTLLDVADSLQADDVLVVLLSGGGSALLAAPKTGLTLADIRTTTEVLLRAGAPISEVNTVRRQLLAAAGGGLGRAASPATLRTLIVSDVLGDPLADIASGPTVISPTTAAHALEVLDRYALRGTIPTAVVALLVAACGDPPDDEVWAAPCTNRVIANNRTAVGAAAAELSSRAYHVEVATDPLVGEAADRGREIAAAARTIESITPTAVVMGGETTVTVRGTGSGGRNQELALAAAIGIEDAGKIVVLAAGTDGIDGQSRNAGAIVDPTTVPRLRRLGLDPTAALDNNDSGTALEAVGDAIRTGPTGTNVCDVTLVLTAPQTDN
jgi:hydroxypyruvate reductase